MARGRACWRAWAAADMEGCWLRGEGSTKPGDRLVEARVCCTERIVWASADSAAAWKEKNQNKKFFFPLTTSFLDSSYTSNSFSYFCHCKRALCKFTVNTLEIQFTFQSNSHICQVKRRNSFSPWKPGWRGTQRGLLNILS